MKTNKIKYLALSGIFCAIIFLLTAYLHIPVGNGYVHIGDAFIFLAASALPLPYAIISAAGGALLADTLTGFALWAPASVVIKTATVLLFSRKGKKIITKRNIFSLIPAAVFCVGGYYLYEVLITSSFSVPALGIPWNVIQSLSSGVIYVFVGLSCDRTNLNELLK
ncbi:MAG: TIGR04002 family protein [Clostridia bacterium]|nr:TIGR04002 family protein [Clostridia bacterium]